MMHSAARSVTGFAFITIAWIGPLAASVDEVIELPPYWVTGSRLERAPTVATGAVHVIKEEDAEVFGFTTPAEWITALSFTPGSGASTSNPWNDNGAQTSANFRGLGIAHHLVLINGRRAAYHPQLDGDTLASDLNNLPAAGLAAILVLPESASAVYGSDAAAGIIDVCLPRSLAGGWAKVRWGDAFDTDVRLLSAEFGRGGRFGRATWVAAVETRERRGLVAGDTRNGWTEDRRAWGGPDLRQGFGWPGQVVLPPGANAPAELIGTPITVGTRLPDGTVQHGLPTSQPQVGDFVALPPPFTDGRPTPGASTNLFDRAPYFTFWPMERSLGGWLMLDVPLSDDAHPVTAFVEAIVRRHHVRSTLHPFRVNLSAEDRRGDGPNGEIILPASNPYNPFGVDLYDVRFSLVEIGPRIRNYRSDSLRFVTGLRGGKPSELAWEAAIGHHRMRTLEHGTNFAGDTQLQDALAGRLGGYLNPFGPSDPGVVDAMRVPLRINAEFDLAFADATLSGPLGRGGWLVGIEGRAEELRRHPDALLQEGGHVAWSPQSALDLERNIGAAFVEATVWPLERLRTWASLRHDRYDDFGSSTRPRLGAEVTLHPDWRLSLTWGDAFKAPELIQLEPSDVVFTGILSDPLRPELGPYEFSYRTGGNADLQPETTTSSRLGLTWSPARRKLHLGVAAWRYHQRDAVTRIGPSLIAELAAAGDASAAARITRAPDTAGGLPGRILIVNDTLGNYAGIRTDGVDFWAEGGLGQWAGVSWRARMEGTWLHHWEYLPADGPPIGLGGRVSFPRWKGMGYLAGERGDWSGSLAARFLGPMRHLSPNYLGGDSNLSAHVTVDARLAHRLARWDLEISLTLTNVLDLNPPVVTDDNRGTPPALYPPVGRGFQVAIERRFR